MGRLHNSYSPPPRTAAASCRERAVARAPRDAASAALLRRHGSQRFRDEMAHQRGSASLSLSGAPVGAGGWLVVVGVVVAILRFSGVS